VNLNLPGNFGKDKIPYYPLSLFQCEASLFRRRPAKETSHP
jgi:hypothetical protein